MNKELLKADIESVLFDKYEVTADKAQPYQEMSFLPSAQSCPTLKRSKMPHSETAVLADLRLAF